MTAQVKKPWKERIRHFTWAWFTVNMGTGVLSALAWNFPYGHGSTALKFFFMFFFWLDLVFFITFCSCMATRYYLFPDIWSKMLAHPAQSMFLGAFPMGAATLINSALILYQDWNWGQTGFLYAIWGFYLLDSAISYLVCFGMIYTMAIRQEHALHKMTAVWLLPVVTLIVASSSGGNIANALIPHSRNMALFTVAFSFTMVVIGLSLALMMICTYLLRLITAGPPDISLILSAFIVLGPLGQGGYSFLVNGANVPKLFPLEEGSSFPMTNISGEIVYGVCFCVAYLLWSMGICWIIIACFSIANQLRKGKIPFSIAYWGLIFPNGVFCLLSLQLAKVLDSGFFRVFAALWIVITFLIWVFAMAFTIPAVINGSIFKAPYLSDPMASAPVLPRSSEKIMTVAP